MGTIELRRLGGMVRVAVVESKDLVPEPGGFLLDREDLTRIDDVPSLTIRLDDVRGLPQACDLARLDGGPEEEPATLFGVGLARVGLDGEDLRSGQDDD